jgi:CspA family cold shock protein
MKGKVKWFNNLKGFGFVVAEGNNDDIFVHFSQIQTEGYKTLKTGQEIEFDLANGEKGKQALNIRSTQKG